MALHRNDAVFRGRIYVCSRRGRQRKGACNEEESIYGCPVNLTIEVAVDAAEDAILDHRVAVDINSLLQATICRKQGLHRRSWLRVSSGYL